MLKTYADLEVRRRELENDLKEVTRQMDEMEPAVLAHMADNGIDKATINGVTFFPKRRLFGSIVEGCSKADVADALIAADLGDFVQNTYNANTLNGYIASFDRESDEALTPAQLKQMLPEALRSVLNIGEVWSVAAQKTSASGKRGRPT